MIPLYNHTSEETAYLIADYPYGFRLRCQMKVWLEFKASKGWRMVSMTSNPKRSGTWNKPKASTYRELGGNLYLDSVGHIQWEGVSIYEGQDKLEAFAAKFPESDLKLIHAMLKRHYAVAAKKLERTLDSDATAAEFTANTQ